MPTQDPAQAPSLEQVREHVSTVAFPTAPPTDPNLPGQVGLEPELFPIVLDARGGPERRLKLDEPGGVLQQLDDLATHDRHIGLRRLLASVPPVYQLLNGGRITFEPGGQIEHSTAVHLSAAAALDDLDVVRASLRAALGARGIVLAAAGVDPWHDVDDVPQQLRAPRYYAQAAYYEKRGPAGKTMMRHTCSLQVNLDLGPPAVAQERWRLSNLISPILTATFSTSPDPDPSGPMCKRALAWQALDPTRSGFPRLLVEGGDTTPGEEWAQAALEADVMLLRRADGSAAPGEPGWTFGTWLREGHPELGYPTLEDLNYHLTTLFLEVRPRGFLEMRSVDALPTRWCPALVVLTTGLLYDDRARHAALDLLLGKRGELYDLWLRAAHAGLHDAELQGLAERISELGLAGARRLHRGFYRSGDIELTERFVERFTAQGRAPADELRAILAEDPKRALAWATGQMDGSG